MLGKTFTVDPISKRRLENFGEEDKFYIRNHHEPIISEEVFEKAQEILARRNVNRGKIGEGNTKRENIVGNMLSVVCWNVVSVVAL